MALCLFPLLLMAFPFGFLMFSASFCRAETVTDIPNLSGFHFYVGSEDCRSDFHITVSVGKAGEKARDRLFEYNADYRPPEADYLPSIAVTEQGEVSISITRTIEDIFVQKRQWEGTPINYRVEKRSP